MQTSPLEELTYRRTSDSRPSKRAWEAFRCPCWHGPGPHRGHRKRDAPLPLMELVNGVNARSTANALDCLHLYRSLGSSSTNSTPGIKGREELRGSLVAKSERLTTPSHCWPSHRMTSGKQVHFWQQHRHSDNNSSRKDSPCHCICPSRFSSSCPLKTFMIPTRSPIALLLTRLSGTKVASGRG